MEELGGDTLIIIIMMGRMGICFTSVTTSWWGEACCLLLCFPTGTSYCVALSAVLNSDYLGECSHLMVELPYFGADSISIFAFDMYFQYLLIQNISWYHMQVISREIIQLCGAKTHLCQLCRPGTVSKMAPLVTSSHRWQICGTLLLGRSSGKRHQSYTVGYHGTFQIWRP